MHSETTRTLLKSAGLKSTPHRLHVYETLKSSPVSMTAEQIYQDLSSKTHAINLSTIYRILDSFVEKQLLTRSFLLDDSKALYEINSQVHRHYLICTSCRRKVSIDTCPLHRLEEELASETGFRIEAHRLELYGICPACSASNK